MPPSINRLRAYLPLQAVQPSGSIAIPPYKENAFIPFIFSGKETEDLLHAVLKRIRRDKKYFLNDIMVYTAIMLLARCGMRIWHAGHTCVVNFLMW